MTTLDRAHGLRVCTPHCGLDPEARLGGEVYEREILTALAAQGIVFDILLARHKSVPEGVTGWNVHRLRMARGLRWPVAAVVLPPAIKRVYDATHFDLLRVHSLRYIGPAALAARRRHGVDVPIVAHHHHLDRGWLNPLIEARVMRGVERVVVGSEFARLQAADELHVPLDKFAVVPYGVDRRFEPGPKPPALVQRFRIDGQVVALFLGTLEPRKNLFFLLDAWREVARERADAHLIVAGTGPLARALERHARALGIGERVTFAGRVPEAEKVAYYHLADVLLFPSKMEGFGFVVAEAMSSGLPVVISDRGSLPELVPDANFLCAPTDQERFVRLTLDLLADPMLRRKIGAANRERVDERFRWDVCARETARVYEDVLAAWRRDRR